MGTSAFVALCFISTFAQPASLSAANARDRIVATLYKEADGVGAFDLKSLVPLDPNEKPTRLQQFIISGTITKCLKGALEAGQEIRYGLFAEGRPLIPAHSIVFLRQIRKSGMMWSAVDGPIVVDSQAVRNELSMHSGCHK